MNRAGRERAHEYWDGSNVMHIWQGQLLTKDGQIDFKSPNEYSESSDRIYIGEFDGTHFFAVNKFIDAEKSPANTLREIAGNLSQQDLELAVTALALINWHESHQKCPRCGSNTEMIENGWVRKCITDGTQHFPRTDPAIIVAVQDRNGRICLGRQSIWPEGRYSNFAGFVEPGENLEAAVIREVEEESGLKVSEIRYLSSQPWPFPNSIMLAFEAFTDQPEKARPDGVEIEDLKWFTKDQLRQAINDGSLKLPPVTSVSGKMIEGWLNG